MSTISDIFGTMVFNESVMRERLPKETYNALKKTIEDLTTFLEQNIQANNKQMQNLTIAQRLINIADNTGVIEKTGANKVVREGVTDMIIDNVKEAYANIQQILPKARIRGALKWFGLGIGVSILSNIITGRIARAKANKN